MPRAFPRYFDIDRRDIAWWLAERILRGRPVPASRELVDIWGMSRSTAWAWRRWALDRQQQLQAREPEHGHINQ